MALSTKIHRIKLGLLAGLVGVLLIPQTTLAVDDSSTEPATESILLSPSFKRYSLDAGETKQDSFDVVNSGQSAFSFVVYARPYSVSNVSYEPDFVTGSKNADAYKWVQFDQPSYEIKPGQTVEVKYTLRVPANATPGGHYGVLFAETQPTGTTEGTAIVRKKRVGSILYATVKGNVTTSGKQIGVDVPFFQFSAPLKIRNTVDNAGNTDFTVSSSVRVSDVLGTLKYKSDKEVAVLPGQPREINNDWQNPAWIGLYKVEQVSKFLDSTKSSSNYVLIVPAWVYLTLVVLIVGRLLYALQTRRRKK